jgi:hypothetical protein
MRKYYGIRRIDGNPSYGDKAIMWLVVETTTDSDGVWISEEDVAIVRSKKEDQRLARILDLAHYAGVPIHKA